MDERGKMLLRSRFEAETNIQISPNPEDWQRYAEWLEELNVHELNVRVKTGTPKNIKEKGGAFTVPGSF